MELNATGERMILDEYTSSIEDYVIYLMHIASYRWVTDIVKGQRVLDFGCGSGYGSAEMAKQASSVEAIDVSEDAIAFANVNYSGSNLRYSSFDPSQNIPFPDASFDVVTSFQVIEHIVDPDIYVREAIRVLVPGGLFVVITPDRSYRLFSWQKPWNRWHVNEFATADLYALLTRHSSMVDMKVMSGDDALCAPEINRCRKLKWSTIPFTLPVYPQAMRVGLLNLVHGMKGRNSAKIKLSDTYGLDENNVRIGYNLSPSLNLVAVATK
ncbi:MAG: class I SAM-dependent methyltransferase [Sphingobium sp.]|nr:class I SAM-dependent methyltransferase [Sphingobium sp.]MCP5399080.1 class I SAM-dependent methyltransferase [Sphingomonas sp.]